MKKEKTQRIRLIKNIRIKFIVTSIIKLIIYLVLAYNIYFLLNTTITKKSYIDIFGFNFFSVESNLMEDELGKNDLVISKKNNQTELKIDDIIVSNVNNKIRINRIINIREINGVTKYVTKFDKNFQPDIEELTIEDIIGKEVKGFKGLGLFLKIGQSKITTVIICISLILYYRYLKELDKKREKKKNLELKKEL